MADGGSIGARMFVVDVEVGVGVGVVLAPFVATAQHSQPRPFLAAHW